MGDEILWERFAASGRIADYLAYRSAENKLESSDDNSRGNSPEGTPCG